MDHVSPNKEKSLVCQPIAFINPKAVYISEKNLHFSFKKLITGLLAHLFLIKVHLNVMEGWS